MLNQSLLVQHLMMLTELSEVVQLLAGFYYQSVLVLSCHSVCD